MSSEKQFEFTKENIDVYLKALAKEYRRLVGKGMPAEYLIAMKLRFGRQYKSDLSDVLGILAAHRDKGTPITLDRVRQAVLDLYEDWNVLPVSSQAYIENVMKNGDFRKIYEEVAAGEKETRSLLIQFEQDYPGVTTKANLPGIIDDLQRKSSRSALLSELRAKQNNS